MASTQKRSKACRDRTDYPFGSLLEDLEVRRLLSATPASAGGCCGASHVRPHGHRTTGCITTRTACAWIHKGNSNICLRRPVRRSFPRIRMSMKTYVHIQGQRHKPVPQPMETDWFHGTSSRRGTAISILSAAGHNSQVHDIAVQHADSSSVRVSQLHMTRAANAGYTGGFRRRRMFFRLIARTPTIYRRLRVSHRLGQF